MDGLGRSSPRRSAVILAHAHAVFTRPFLSEEGPGDEAKLLSELCHVVS